MVNKRRREDKEAQRDENQNPDPRDSYKGQQKGRYQRKGRNDNEWEENGPILGCPQKLRIKSRKLPDFSNNLLTHVTETIKDGIKDTF